MDNLKQQVKNIFGSIITRELDSGKYIGHYLQSVYCEGKVITSEPQVTAEDAVDGLLEKTIANITNHPGKVIFQGHGVSIQDGKLVVNSGRVLGRNGQLTRPSDKRSRLII